MRRAFTGLAVLVLATTALVSAARPALACTIAGGLTEEDHRKSADLVFTGTVVRLEDPTNGVSFSSMDPLYWTFVVDNVEKGEVPARVTVASAMMGASCGYEFKLGTRYRVYASQDDEAGHLTTGLGSGNTPLPAVRNGPKVEGVFHTLEYNLWQARSLGVPAAVLALALGFGWWAVRRSERRSAAA